MPVNKRSKFRGSRTCGGGTHKNRRGAGNRGGRGAAGWRDHNFTRFYFLGRTEGKHGFVCKTSYSWDVMDIGEIDELVPSLLARGLASQEGDVVKLDAASIGVEKVLGGGKVTRKLAITAEAFSASAVAKIEEKGGQALSLE
ncbi:MAG TPA: uL15 family ribosomal protein [Methanocorpusculum sp.]|nr:uL15m family ribosomal protein [Methanocorpusculum sp.]HJJ27157.1 uL15 family ribosomal protein [Methanocorpusculum sp.]